MAKTKNYSVRFDEDKIVSLRSAYPEFNSPQKIVDFLLDYWFNRTKEREVVQSKPEIFDMLPSAMKKRLSNLSGTEEIKNKLLEEKKSLSTPEEYDQWILKVDNSILSDSDKLSIKG